MKILNFKLQITSFQNGFSVIEVILAAAIFVTIATGAVVAVISGIDNNRLGGEMTVANQFAAEGLEAVRSIRNQDFANLIDTTGTGVAPTSTTYYFNSWNDRDSWNDNNPSEMTNGSILSFSYDDTDGHYVYLDANEYISGGAGQVAKVEVRAYIQNDWTASQTMNTPVISMTPYFNGTDVGGAYGPSAQRWDTPAWTEYYDITNDSSGPGVWSWAHVANLGMRVTTVNPTGFGNVGVARVEIRVTATPSQWIFSGSNNTLRHNAADNYIRTIKVESVNRDAGGNIVPAGTPAPDTKKVTSTVTWNFTTARPESVELVSYLTNWKAPIAPIVTGGPIMMAYAKVNVNTPFYRIWNGSEWSAEASANAVDGNINYVVLKSSRTRNEVILGTLDSSGQIYTQIWNGTSWTTPRLMGTGLAAYRGFDIEYEKNGDRAVVVYLPTATSVDPAYQVWDGNSWIITGTTITMPPTTGIVRWIDVAQNPLSTSNEIAMIMFDANSDIYGMVWTGAGWSNMGNAAVWDATASTANTRKAMAVAYEQNTGRAMFVWADATATDQYYRIWNGTTLTTATLLDIPASGGIGNWVKLVSRPNSDELLYGVQDAGADLNTRKWSGSAWDTATQHVEHSAGVENITSMVFDLVWETHTSNPGKAWLMMGNGNTVQKKQWSGLAWGTASTLTGGDDTSFIKLKADPVSGAIFAGIYEDSTSATDDIWESRLTGGGTTWSVKNIIWGGATSATPVYFRIDIATP